MSCLRALMRDESGLVLSAEAVTIATLGVVGVTVGMTAVGRSVEAELDDVAMSIRSLDQSYAIRGFHGVGSRTAGSSFTQVAVEESRAELRRQIERDRREAEKRYGVEQEDSTVKQKKKPAEDAKKKKKTKRDDDDDDDRDNRRRKSSD
jgi:hypothetical protein